MQFCKDVAANNKSVQKKYNAATIFNSKLLFYVGDPDGCKLYFKILLCASF